MSRMLEPEWTEYYRSLAEGHALHERERCTGCGIHPHVLANPETVHLTLEDTYCEMCKLQARHGRRVADLDTKFDKEHPDAEPGVPRPTDGLNVVIKTLTPAEVAERKRRRTDG